MTYLQYCCFSLIPATKYLNLNMKYREQCRLNHIEADPQSVNPKPSITVQGKIPKTSTSLHLLTIPFIQM